jgi:Xaa-Pro dipeptidase
MAKNEQDIPMRPAYQALYAAHLFELQQRTKAVLAR